jgi:hypothetical protein
MIDLMTDRRVFDQIGSNAAPVLFRNCPGRIVVFAA